MLKGRQRVSAQSSTKVNGMHPHVNLLLTKAMLVGHNLLVEVMLFVHI
jgi:hypothetical protein